MPKLVNYQTKKSHAINKLNIDKGSVPSLAAGLLFGAAATYGAILTSQNPKNYYLGLATSGFLMAFMGMRFYRGGKFMPAGLMTVLSLAQTARLGMRIGQNQKYFFIRKIYSRYFSFK